MNCENAQDLINERLDGILAAKEEASLRAHLAGCPACAQEERVLSEALTLVAIAPLQSPSVEFNEKVLEAAGLDTQAAHWLPWAGAAFGLGIAAWSAAAIAAAAWFLDPGALAQWFVSAPSPAEFPGLAALACAKAGLRTANILSLMGAIGRSLLQTMDPASLIFPLAASTILSAGILTALTGSGNTTLPNRTSRSTL